MQPLPFALLPIAVAAITLLACSCHSEHTEEQAVSSPSVPEHAPIIVSGFNPFAGRPVNGSSLLARLIRENHPNDPVEVLELPVTWGSPAQALASVQKKNAQLWIAFGEGTNDAFRIETVADNQRGGFADESGSLPAHRLIFPGAMEQRLSTFPASELAQVLTQLGFPTRVSTEAGDYLCEEMLYTLLHDLQQNQDSSLEEALFIHIPVLGATLTLPDGTRQPIDRDYLARFAEVILPEIMKLTEKQSPLP